MNERRLTRELGRLLRLERERARLTQAALAARAGTSQQCVSRFEAARSAPTTTVVERLFGALGQQLRLDLEACDADLDDAMERARSAGVEEAATILHDLHYVLRRAGELRYLVDGELAARLQGAPVRPTRFDLAVPETELDALAAWVDAIPNCTRYVERWRDFGGYDIDPRHDGPLRWMTPYRELRVRLLPTWPEPVLIRVEDRDVPLRSLLDIELDDPQIARVLRRLRAQSDVGREGPSTSSASTIV